MSGVLDTLAWPFTVIVDDLSALGLSVAAVMLITVVLVRALVAPLAVWQARQQRVLGAIAPEIARITEREDATREELRAELTALYRSHRVMPLSTITWMIPQGVALGLLYWSLVGLMHAGGATSIFGPLAERAHESIAGWALLVFAAGSMSGAMAFSAMRVSPELSRLTRVLMLCVPVGLLLSALYISTGGALYLAAIGATSLIQAGCLLVAFGPPSVPARAVASEPVR